MAVVDELRLKVSAEEYIRRIGILDAKINELGGILTEYQSARNEAVQVLGDDDANLNRMQAAIDQNIKAVQGQQNLLKEQRNLLQQQMDNLGMLTTHVGEMFQEGLESAKSLYNTIKAVGEITG